MEHFKKLTSMLSPTKSHECDLEVCTLASVEKFKLKGVRMCKVLKVFDGDTCTIAYIHDCGNIYQWQVRMLGYDAPEISPLLSTPNRVEIVARATEIRDALRELVLNKIVYSKTDKLDKYGRFLVNLYFDEACTENVNTKIMTMFNLPEKI